MTDYWRIKEHLSLVENSVLKLRRLIKIGGREAVEIEAIFLRHNYCVLLHIRKDSFFDIRIIRLEKEVRELLQEAYSFLNGGE
jgi:hypothetical protein